VQEDGDDAHALDERRERLVELARAAGSLASAHGVVSST
jgi:hypothetical protein